MSRQLFDQLGQEVADALGAAPSAPSGPEQARLLHHLERDYRRRRRNRAVVTSSLALVLVAVGLFWALAPDKAPALELRGPGGRAVAVGEWISPRGAPMAVHSSDGGELVLARGSRARVSHVGRRGIRVALESGRLRASVKHREGFRWDFGAGPYEVQVVGTRLAISWGAQRGELAVSVAEGAVRVRGDHLGATGVMVRKGQRLDASVERRSMSVSPASDRDRPTHDAAVKTDAGLTTRADLGVPARPKAAPPSMHWRKLARAGDYRSAAREARRAGLSRLLTRLGAADLMLLADAGRLGADAELAARAYRALRRRAQGRREGTLAAFRLGRLYYEQLRDYTRAAAWFARYEREAPRGAFVADARGRRMIALQRAGKIDAARQAATRYLALHPGGAYASSARALTAR